jgi:GNAT superfamily N-acetyltransferase
MDLWAYRLIVRELAENMPEKVERVGQKILARRNLIVRPIDMRNWDEEVARVRGLYNVMWEANWAFVPFTDKEWDHYAEQLKPAVDPDFALLVEREGEVVGFALAFPDLNESLRMAYPKPGTPEPITLLKWLWYWKVRRVSKWLRVPLLGSLPELRGIGLEALLYIQLVKNAHKKGYEFGEGSWMLENNDMMNRGARSLGGEVYKTYRIYQKAL